MKKALLIVFLLLLLIPVSEVLAIRSRGVRPDPYTTSEGFFGIKFQHEVEVPGFGNVTILTDYSSTINLSSWEITDNKDLVIELSILNQPENLSMWVEHMHADTFIESTLQYWDGVIQDTMDDSYHSDLSYGFFIDEDYGYSETFSIEGLSQMIQQHYSSYWYHSDTTHRLTENELITKFKVYGSSFRIIYDIVFRENSWPGDRTPKIIIEDNIILSLSEGWQGNEGDLADKPAGLDPITKFLNWLDSPGPLLLPLWFWFGLIGCVILVIAGVIIWLMWFRDG